MQYQIIPPPDHLKAHIKYFWTLEYESDSPYKIFRTVADGCPGMIIHQTVDGEFYQHEKRLPTAFLYGQATTHAELYVGSKSQTLGVFFYPHALSSIFGLNADELTDDCVDLDLLQSSRQFYTVEKLLSASSTEQQIKVVSCYLLSQLENNKKHADEAVQHSVSLILKSEGCISLGEIRSKLQMSERNFERKFKQAVGISPKLFSRIRRFQASLSQLKQNKYNKLSDIAFDKEYSDQSHFIRTFKEFAGFSPFQYQKQSVEVVENLLKL